MDINIHPQTKAVITTRAKPLGITVVEVDASAVSAAGYSDSYFAIIVQYPDTTGEVRDYELLSSRAHQDGALVIAATDLLSLTLLTPPGEWGADISVGTSQRFGVPMGFGGPHAGFLAVRNGLERSMPGRLVGQSIDSNGLPAFRLALQTREQHIRRDKATSNICTAQVLLANMSAFYAMWHGPAGLTSIAKRVQSFASRLHGAALAQGRSTNQNIFDTVTISVDDEVKVRTHSESLSINFAYPGEGVVRVSFDEESTEKELAQKASFRLIQEQRD
jgi:glycine dehydrogenase